MTLKQFIEENNVSGFETIGSLLFNVIVDDSIPYGLNVDTSNIISNTPLETVTNFEIQDNLLIVEGKININMNEITLLE
jgi:hypothetical protein